MRTTLIIAGRDLRALFRSPLAWLLLAGASFIIAWVFLWFVQGYMTAAPHLPVGAQNPGITALVAAPTLLWSALVLVVLTPLLAMRLLAEERRNGTLNLLRAAPVSMSSLVAGKFLALLAFLWLVVAIAAAMPLSLELGTTLDLGRLGAGVLALALLAAAFGAISLFISSLTRQPLLAAFASFGAIIGLWIINLAAGTTSSTSPLAWLAFQPHLNALLRGVVDSTDLAYFVILTLFFLGLSVWRLDAERLSG
ncbi:MAG: ABC transporter permease [Gammaproteobacteria bacterium]